MEHRDLLVRELAVHEPAVYTYFRRMGRQPADAADLTQDTFLRALRGIDRFRGDSAYRTWLLGIARNLHREWLRSRRPTESADDVELAAPGSTEDGAAVAEALGRLPLEQRELLVLAHVEGLPSKEIAVLYGISDAAARQRISRATAAFRDLWGER